MGLAHEVAVTVAVVVVVVTVAVVVVVVTVAVVVVVTCNINTISQRRSAGEPSGLWQGCCGSPLVRTLVVHVAGGENTAAVAAGDREPKITTINTQTQRASESRDTRATVVQPRSLIELLLCVRSLNC